MSDTIDPLAVAIACELFTSGAPSGARAERLKLEGPDGRDLGGWSDGGAVNAIARVLAKWAADNPEKSTSTGHGCDWLRTLPPSLAADLQSSDGLRRATALASATERELRALTISANHEAAKGKRA